MENEFQTFRGIRSTGDDLTTYPREKTKTWERLNLEAPSSVRPR